MSGLYSINPYDGEEFKKQNNEWFLSRVPADARLLWDTTGDTYIPGSVLPPRDALLLRHWSVVPYYYLKFLRDINPTNAVDMGCGSNHFGWIFRNTITVDPRAPNADIKSTFEDFPRTDKYDAFVAMNSLHLMPMTSFSSRMYEIADLVRPGGRAYVSFLTRQMQKRSPETPSNDEIISYLDSEIRALKLKLLVVDQVYPERTADNDVLQGCVDGNIRIVFESE